MNNRIVIVFEETSPTPDGMGAMQTVQVKGKS